jgi:hypothetical protein
MSSIGRGFSRGTSLKPKGNSPGEHDVLIFEDLDVRSLIRKVVTKKRRVRLYGSSFSELRKILE